MTDTRTSGTRTETATAMAEPIRSCYPPSPTGNLHVGGARTALFNWLAARATGGTFILRIEDTDRLRYNPESVDSIFDGLRWLDLQWDEGPEIGGPVGPYVQSERLALYRQWAQWLLDHGYAYEDYDPPRPPEQRKELDTEHAWRRYRDYTSEQMEEVRRTSGRPPAVHLKLPFDGDITVRDLVRGDITWKFSEMPVDPVLLKSDGFPTYHLAQVVDDHLMNRNVVLRGPEWLPSTPIHAYLFRAFGWEEPSFCHLPLVTDQSGKKLSKREGSTAVQEYREGGYLPEAIVNYLCLLGWSYGDDIEVFTKEEAARRFRVEDIRPAPSKWDGDKLLSVNGHYINHILTLDEFVERSVPFLEAAGLLTGAHPPEYIRAVLALEKERAKTLAEVPHLTEYFFREPPADAAMRDLLRKEGKEQTAALLEADFEALGGVNFADHDAVFAALDGVATAFDVKRRAPFMLVRIAMSGRTATPELGDVLRVLGPERVNNRLRAALDALHAQ